MKKKRSKIIAFVCALALVMSMAVPVFAGAGGTTPEASNTQPDNYYYGISADTTVVNGTITADKTKAKAGDTITVTVTPEKGYVVDTVTVKDKDGNTVETKSGTAENTYTFTMPAAEVTVTVTFKSTTTEDKTTYTVTVGASENGTVTVDPTSAAEGGVVTVTVSPKNGYKVDAVTVTDANGKAVAAKGTGNTYTFTMPAANVTVTATFSEDTTTGEPVTPPSTGDDDSSSTPGTGSGSGSGSGTTTPITPPTTPSTPDTSAPSTEELAKEDWTVEKPAAGNGDAPVYTHKNADGTLSTGSTWIEYNGKGARYLFDKNGALQTGTQTADTSMTVNSEGEVMLNGNLYFLNPDRNVKDPRTCFVMTDYIRSRNDNGGKTYYDKDGITFEGWLLTPQGGLRYQTRLPQGAGKNDMYLIVWRAQKLPAMQHPDHPGDPAYMIPAGWYFFDDSGVLVTEAGWYDGQDGNLYRTNEQGAILEVKAK